MEKRSSPLTVMLEPSVHQLLKDNHENLSMFVRDMLVRHLEVAGLLPKDLHDELYGVNHSIPDPRAKQECANCGNDIPTQIEWFELVQGYLCTDTMACKINKQIQGRV